MNNLLLPNWWELLHIKNKMQRENIIVLTAPDIIQCWGNFKKACEENNLPYHSLKMLRFPIQYKEYVFYKVPFNNKEESISKLKDIMPFYLSERIEPYIKEIMIKYASEQIKAFCNHVMHPTSDLHKDAQDWINNLK